jgi:ElaB/YqjD/DUF883 family membrane-anchored ribosome-binding protein
MRKHKNGDHDHGIQESAGILVDDTRALLSATAECAEEGVMAARERISDALDSAKETYISVQKDVVRRAKAADKVIRAKPYQAIGVALGVGALIGFLFGRRR